MLSHVEQEKTPLTRQFDELTIVITGPALAATAGSLIQTLHDQAIRLDQSSADRRARVVLAGEIRGEHLGEQLSGKTDTTGTTDSHG
jgi:hypothetical protein